MSLNAKNRKILHLESHRPAALIEAQHRIATGPLDAQVIMGDIIKAACLLCLADGGLVQMIEGEDLVCIEAFGQGTVALHTGLEVANSLAQTCIARKGAICVSDAPTDPRINQSMATLLGLRSMIIAPLQIREGVVGILQCFLKFQAHSMRCIHTRWHCLPFCWQTLSDKPTR